MKVTIDSVFSFDSVFSLESVFWVKVLLSHPPHELCALILVTCDSNTYLQRYLHQDPVWLYIDKKMYMKDLVTLYEGGFVWERDEKMDSLEFTVLSFLVCEVSLNNTRGPYARGMLCPYST